MKGMMSMMIGGSASERNDEYDESFGSRQSLFWLVRSFIIPHTMSCGGYNIFDLSVCQPFFFDNTTPLKLLNEFCETF